MLIRKIELFYDQEKPDDKWLTYDSGKLVESSSGRLCIAYEERGARMLYSVGQPIYDTDYNLLGHLGIGIYNNLNYCDSPNKEHDILIPVYFWSIENQTRFAISGTKVKTYWHYLKEKSKHIG
jgi:hypothetical protein